MTGIHVSAVDIALRYTRGGPMILDDVSLDLQPGTVTAICGESGCGKSTLLFLLGLLLTPTSGEVLYDGQPVSSLSDTERSRFRSRDIGFVFQDARLDQSRSVLGNVLEPVSFRRESIAPYRERAHRLLDEMGVEVPAARRCFALSGGQAQRIALCRALLHRPKILLADEPTGNLDPASAASVLSALRGAAIGGATVAIVTHSKDVISYADRSLELTAH